MRTSILVLAALGFLAGCAATEEGGGPGRGRRTGGAPGGPVGLARAQEGGAGRSTAARPGGPAAGDWDLRGLGDGRGLCSVRVSSRAGGVPERRVEVVCDGAVVLSGAERSLDHLVTVQGMVRRMLGEAGMEFAGCRSMAPSPRVHSTTCDFVGGE